MNAPGSENTTTVLPLKISSVVTGFQSLSVRVRNVTCGTFWPSRFANTAGTPIHENRNGQSLGRRVPAIQFFVRMAPIGGLNPGRDGSSAASAPSR